MNKLIVLCAVLAVSKVCARGEQIVIKGSDTLGAKLVPQLKEAFRAENPGISFSIAAEGSGTGFTALIDDTANIGMASRPAMSTEVSKADAKGLKLHATIIALDGIVVIINKANPVKNLTKDQIEKIFTGDIDDWSAVGGNPGKISIYTRNASSGTYVDFKELAMSKRDYAPDIQNMAGNEQIVAEVARNVHGIGYVGLAYIKNPKIVAVSVDEKTPTKENIRNKSYPYSRETFFYTNREPSGATKKFIEFTLSPKGQKIIEEVGFLPVK